MLNQEKTSLFNRDFKRCQKKHWDMHLLKEAMKAVVFSDEQEISHIYNDHSLLGKLKGYRQLHINGQKSNWLLQYIIADGTVYFSRTGTHDDIL